MSTSFNASAARRLELADESLGWSDDRSGSDSEFETDSGEYETHGQLAVFDLRRHARAKRVLITPTATGPRG